MYRRRTTFIRSVIALALCAGALVMPFASARADTPIRQTRVNAFTFNQLDVEDTIGLGAEVSPVPAANPFNITGSLTFRDEQGNVLGTDDTLNPDNGYGLIYVPKPTQPTTFTVEFHATGDLADSTGTTLYKPGSLRTVNVLPEPTILKITAGSPKLTLTLAAYTRFPDGTPAAGVHVSFDGQCLVRDARGMCAVPLTWCTAVSDANGLATCKGAGTLGALVSLLNGAVFIQARSSNPGHYVTGYYGSPPVIVRS